MEAVTTHRQIITFNKILDIYIPNLKARLIDNDGVISSKLTHKDLDLISNLIKRVKEKDTFL